ncbi:MAG TPA: cytochrome c [Opitutaceae bacterium]
MLRKLLKLLGLLLGGLVLLLLVGSGIVYLMTQQRLQRRYTVEIRPVAVPTNEAAIAHGRHIAATRGCADCHGANFAGRPVIQDPLVGQLHGSNLTRGQGGLPADYGDLDFVRAIRHGLASDGRPLVLMPSEEYSHLSDEDLGALIAYLKTLTPVDRRRGPVEPGPLARLLITLGEIRIGAEHIDHAASRPSRVVAGVTVDYGRYLAASCTGCHGNNLAGGKIPGAPPDWPAAANLTPHMVSRLPHWTEEDFLRVLRTAQRPDGTEVHPVMPRAFGQMTDDELKALWVYLRSLPPAAERGPASS